MSAARIVLLVFVLLTAGCAEVGRVPPSERPQTFATQGAAAAVESGDCPATLPTNQSSGESVNKPDSAGANISAKVPASPAPIEQLRTKEGAAPATGQSVAKPDPAGANISAKAPASPAPIEQLRTKEGAPATGQGVGKPDSEGTNISAKAPASPAPIEQLGKKESAASVLEKQQASPTLDLASLKNRLKETKAIGLFTKIALKNQVDDLLNQFRAYYRGPVKTTLAELRQRYDLLLLKVLSLLQDSDQSLATAIGASREAIWGILADRQKFTSLV